MRYLISGAKSYLRAKKKSNTYLPWNIIYNDNHALQPVNDRLIRFLYDAYKTLTQMTHCPIDEMWNKLNYIIANRRHKYHIRVLFSKKKNIYTVSYISFQQLKAKAAKRGQLIKPLLSEMAVMIHWWAMQKFTRTNHICTIMNQNRSQSEVYALFQNRLNYPAYFLFTVPTVLLVWFIIIGIAAGFLLAFVFLDII